MPITVNDASLQKRYEQERNAIQNRKINAEKVLKEDKAFYEKFPKLPYEYAQLKVEDLKTVEGKKEVFRGSGPGDAQKLRRRKEMQEDFERKQKLFLGAKADPGDYEPRYTEETLRKFPKRVRETAIKEEKERRAQHAREKKEFETRLLIGNGKKAPNTAYISGDPGMVPKRVRETAIKERKERRAQRAREKKELERRLLIGDPGMVPKQRVQHLSENEKAEKRWKKAQEAFKVKRELFKEGGPQELKPRRKEGLEILPEAARRITLEEEKKERIQRAKERKEWENENIKRGVVEEYDSNSDSEIEGDVVGKSLVVKTEKIAPSMFGRLLRRAPTTVTTYTYDWKKMNELEEENRNKEFKKALYQRKRIRTQRLRGMKQAIEENGAYEATDPSTREFLQNMYLWDDDVHSYTSIKEKRKLIKKIKDRIQKLRLKVKTHWGYKDEEEMRLVIKEIINKEFDGFTPEKYYKSADNSSGLYWVKKNQTRSDSLSWLYYAAPQLNVDTALRQMDNLKDHYMRVDKKLLDVHLKKEEIIKGEKTHQNRQKEVLFIQKTVKDDTKEVVDQFNKITSQVSLKNGPCFHAKKTWHAWSIVQCLILLMFEALKLLYMVWAYATNTILLFPAPDPFITLPLKYITLFIWYYLTILCLCTSSITLGSYVGDDMLGPKLVGVASKAVYPVARAVPVHVLWHESKKGIKQAINPFVKMAREFGEGLAQQEEELKKSCSGWGSYVSPSCYIRNFVSFNDEYKSMYFDFCDALDITNEVDQEFFLWKMHRGIKEEGQKFIDYTIQSLRNVFPDVRVLLQRMKEATDLLMPERYFSGTAIKDFTSEIREQKDWWTPLPNRSLTNTERQKIANMGNNVAALRNETHVIVQNTIKMIYEQEKNYTNMILEKGEDAAIEFVKTRPATDNSWTTMFSKYIHRSNIY